jgi:hypothetical protein
MRRTSSGVAALSFYLGQICHWHDARDDGLRHAEVCEVIDHRQVMLRFKEELRCGVVGDAKFVGEESAIGGEIRRTRMTLWMSGYSNTQVGDLTKVLH